MPVLWDKKGLLLWESDPVFLVVSGTIIPNFVWLYISGITLGEPTPKFRQGCSSCFLDFGLMQFSCAGKYLRFLGVFCKILIVFLGSYKFSVIFWVFQHLYGTFWGGRGGVLIEISCNLGILAKHLFKYLQKFYSFKVLYVSNIKIIKEEKWTSLQEYSIIIVAVLLLKNYSSLRKSTFKQHWVLSNVPFWAKPNIPNSVYRNC